MNRVYLDHNATTAIRAGGARRYAALLVGEFAMPLDSHLWAEGARRVETAREQVGALIGARAQEIVFTSGGTEADNNAIFGVLTPFVTWPASRAASLSDDPDKRLSIAHLKHVITTNIEHEAVLNTCQALEKQGVPVTYLPVDGKESFRQRRCAALFASEPSRRIALIAMKVDSASAAMRPTSSSGCTVPNRCGVHHSNQARFLAKSAAQRLWRNDSLPVDGK